MRVKSHQWPEGETLAWSRDGDAAGGRDVRARTHRDTLRVDRRPQPPGDRPRRRPSTPSPSTRGLLARRRTRSSTRTASRLRILDVATRKSRVLAGDATAAPARPGLVAEGRPDRGGQRRRRDRAARPRARLRPDDPDLERLDGEHRLVARTARRWRCTPGAATGRRATGSRSSPPPRTPACAARRADPLPQPAGLVSRRHGADRHPPRLTS